MGEHHLASSLEVALRPWLIRMPSVQPGISADEVKTKLSSVGRKTSADVLQFFTIVNGFPEGKWDEHAFTLWPVDQCVKECARYESDLIPFADFLISSCEYCFKREAWERSSVVVCYSPTDGRQVAESVEQFFQLLITDPMRLEIVL
jgi:hypothetical protein